MKSSWIALGLLGALPMLAAAQTTTSHSVIKPVGFGYMSKGGCSSCVTPAPTCCTPVPPPSMGRCCPRPCLLESLRRGFRSLNSLLPCNLGCHSSCNVGCATSCNSCTASCATTSSCQSCCTKTRAHFFAFCKPRCGTTSCCEPVGCATGVPHHMGIPQPIPDMGDPFKDDVKPMQPNATDPNMPPAGRETYYRPYWKKNGPATAASPTPARAKEPTHLDPYAVAPPVHIKARPVTAAPRSAQPSEPVKVAAVAQDVAPVSLTVADDEPPAPPQLLPVTASPLRQLDRSIPANPLRR